MGFQARADLVDNTTLYASSQNGAIRRIDKLTGESKAIAPPRFWGDSQRTRTAFEMPYIISPHNHNRLYVLANVLFRSENRGDKYTVVGGDLTRAPRPRHVHRHGAESGERTPSTSISTRTT
jgi:hypothetical protein